LTLARRASVIAIVLSLAVAAALLVLQFVATAPVESAVVDSDNKPSCVIPDVDVPRAVSTTNFEGYPVEQTWATNSAALEQIGEVTDLVADEFGGEDGSREALENGLIGVTLDETTKEIVVVADTDVVDETEIEENVVEEVEGDALDVRVGESCRGAKALLRAWDVLDERNWMEGLERLNIGYGLNPETSQWDVSLPPERRDVGERLKQILGGAVNIEYEELTLNAGSRDEDVSPHYGGAALTDVKGTDHICTSMATVQLPNGDKGSVTAGHCFRNDDKVFSGGVRYGTAKGRSGYPEKDMVRIHPSGGDTFHKKVWITPDEPAAVYVAGSSNMSNGQYHCSSGATSLRLCGHEVNSVNYTLCMTDQWGISGCRQNLTRSISYNLYVDGGFIVAQGDSGAPLYTHRWPEIDIRGMLVGGNINGTRMFGHKINEIKNHLQVSNLAH